MTQRTIKDRLKIITGVKLTVIQHDIENDVASKVLFLILDDYHLNGTTYKDKELTLHLKDISRKYVINLHNDTNIKDCVLIRAVEM